MQVTIIPATGSPFQLASAGGQSQPLDNQRLGGSGEMQIAKYLRAPSAATFYRGNEQTPLTFTVVKEFASPDLAEKFMFTHRSQVPKKGTIKLVGVGGSTSTIPNATIQSVDFTPRGTSVEVTYTIVGGLMS